MELEQRWHELNANILELAKQYPAKEARRLLAVSKYAPVEAVRALYQIGQRDFAESYWQAARTKMAALSDLNICWHFIGHLQSNKCELIALHFDWVHSIAKLKQVPLLANGRGMLLPPLQVCLQVNLSADPQKYGALPKALPSLIEEVLQYPQLQLRGLMLLPHKGESNDFKKLALLRDELTQQYQLELSTLSMGMSDDYQEAIKAGATIIRIGSALFN